MVENKTSLITLSIADQRDETDPVDEMLVNDLAELPVNVSHYFGHENINDSVVRDEKFFDQFFFPGERMNIINISRTR